jgi:hypothetical protein
VPDGAAKSLRISKRNIKFFVTEKGLLRFGALPAAVPPIARLGEMPQTELLNNSTIGKWRKVAQQVFVAPPVSE